MKLTYLVRQPAVWIDSLSARSSKSTSAPSVAVEWSRIYRHVRQPKWQYGNKDAEWEFGPSAHPNVCKSWSLTILKSSSRRRGCDFSAFDAILLLFLAQLSLAILSSWLCCGGSSLFLLVSECFVSFLLSQCLLSLLIFTYQLILRMAAWMLLINL